MKLESLSYEEAKEKLERTDENLVRINDKIDELELQVEPLRLQAEKTKKYNILRDELKGLEISVWLEQLEQLAKYGDELQAEVAWLAANAPRNTVNQVEDFGDDLEELQVETNTLIDIVRVNTDKARGDLHSMDEEMTAQVDAISSSMDALTDGLRDSRNQIRNQKRQIEDQIDQIRGTISDGVDRGQGGSGAV